MNNMPLVSIGMPVFNDLPFLSKALDSLLAQTYSNFELIIADDGSSDGSAAVCTDYAQMDSRIRYIRHEKNLGVSANMNFLLREANGEFFMLAADDDFWDPSFMEIMVAQLLLHSETISVFCPMVFVDEKNEILTDPAPRASEYSGKNSWVRLRKFIQIFDDGPGYSVFRRNASDGLAFPVWWGVNSRTAYDNLYPPICYLLAKGNALLVSDRPLWYNRFKTGIAINHSTPFTTGSGKSLIALILRKINLVWAALLQVLAAGKPWTALAIAPLMTWHWLLLPVSGSILRGIRQRLVIPAKESAGRMVVSQLAVHLIVFSSLPLVSRWYPPAEIGVWVFFQSSVLLLWSFSQIKTDQLIITTDDRQKRSGLVALGMTAHVLFSLLFAGLVTILSRQWEIPLFSSGYLIAYWLGFGALNLKSSVFTAEKSFSGVNFFRLFSAATAYPFSLGAWYIWGNNGLIVSLLLSVWLPLIPSIRPLFHTSDWLSGRFFRQVLTLAKEQKESSIWMTVNSFIVAFSDHIFTLVIAGVYDLKTAGAFFLVQKITMAPVSLLNSTYGLYHFRHFHELFRARRLTTTVFTAYWIKWLPVAVLFYGVIAFWGDSVFALIFGSPYEGTGIWAGALALRCGVQFLSSPVSTGFYAMQQPRPPVYSGLFSLVITLIALLFMVFHGLPLHQILWIHSILMVFNILLYNIFMLSAVQKLQR